MALVDGLIDQLNKRGLTVHPGNNPGELLLKGPAKERSPEIMNAIKRFKADLLRVYGKPREQAAPPEPEPERFVEDAKP